MNKTYSESFELRACQCDMNGIWSPSRILETMQESAGVHSAQCGLDRSTLTGMGLAWVLTRTKVEFTRPARSGETIHVETYPTPNRHLFFPRSHIFRDAQGEIIGRANSLWVLLDIETRRIVKNDDVAACLPDNRDLSPAAGMPATVRLPEGEAVVSEIAPRFTDLDVNLHVNNTKYLDWCVNALGFEVMKDRCLIRFDVNYDAEVRPGCAVRTELVLSGDAFAFCGSDGEKRNFGISGSLVSLREG